jgi:hypothetical protein
MDTGLLNLTRRVTETREVLERETRVAGRCVIPGCKYTAPIGPYCGLHRGRELASRVANPNYAVKFERTSGATHDRT